MCEDGERTVDFQYSDILGKGSWIWFYCMKGSSLTLLSFFSALW